MSDDNLILRDFVKNNLILRVRDFAKNNSEKDDIHGFPHVERVYNTCVALGSKLNANLLVLKIASLLHDIGRIREKNNLSNKNHAEMSTEMAKEFFKELKHPLAQEDVTNILHCIKAHSFSNNLIPKTLESKILSDADKLDAIGAIGLYRTIGFTIKNLRKSGS